MLATPTKIAIVDDHNLFLNGLAEMVREFEGYEVISTATNGRQFISQVQQNEPHIAIVDIQMAQMDGEEVTKWLHKNLPHVKVMALTMYDDEVHVLRMIRAGANAYMLKNASPTELKQALDGLTDDGVFHTELVRNTIHKSLRGPDPDGRSLHLTNKELEFLKLCCSDLTYKEIANQMDIAERTADSYREHLFEKLQVKSRVGMVLFVVKHNLVSF